MSSNESAAYEIMRSLDVDYVLIIFGGVIGYSGDDINKFLWMVRIAEGEHPRDIRVRETSHTLALFPQSRRIITAAAVRQFAVVVCSHRAKQLQRNSHSKPVLQIKKRRHDDVCEFFQRVSPLSSC